MASTKQPSFFGLPQDGKLGFQSDLQYNWRDNPSVATWREIVKNGILMYLAQYAFGDSGQAVATLASRLESQLFMDALSQDDYMDQEKLLDRIQILIRQNWYQAKSAPRATHTTKSLSVHTSAPTPTVLKSNFGINVKNSIPDYVMSANVGNLVPTGVLNGPYLTTDEPEMGFYGSRKRTSDAILRHPEQVLPNHYSTQEGFFRCETVNSPPTFSGSVLQYESEASFGSHCKKSQCFSEVERDLIVLSNQSSPSVQTPSMVGEKLEVPTVSDEVHVQQPLLESPQFEQQLLLPKLQCDERGFRKMESSCTASMQNKKLHAFQDAAAGVLPPSRYAGFGQHSHNNVQCGSVDEILSCYIIYSRNCLERKGRFLDFWHSQKCSGGMCSCEHHKKLLLHFDNCGSADCGICGATVRALTNCGNITCVDMSEDFKKPTKCRKRNPSSSIHGASCDVSGLPGSIRPSGPLNFEQQSGPPVITSVDNPEANMELITSNVPPSRIREASNGAMDDILGRNSRGSLADFEQKEMDSAAPHELNDEGSDNPCNLLSDCVPSLCEDKCIALIEEAVTKNDQEETEGKTIEKCHPSLIGSLNDTKSEKQKVNGITLIDFFTAEEIRTHMSSLRQKADKGTAEEVFGSIATCSRNENICQLCALDRLAFPPMPIYCSSCAARVKNFSPYYSTMDENRVPFCFCTSCYNKCRGSNITLFGFSISKNNLELKKNNLVTEESWVQCDKCEGWQHQICALFNDKRDLGGKAEYACPKCYLEDLGTGEHMTLSRSTYLDASNLPQTLLSNHLEQRLFQRLKDEREDRAKSMGKNPEEIPQPADLVVRVVSAVDKRLKVKQEFLDIFPNKNYPSEFPYRSKVILLFQKIEGVDVCLFAMYVQEFGSECSQPNQRCVYISYIDSVKYFRPEGKTLKGEALRTFVYHEILVGYLDYCKKRGFATCYIWACPPVKGEDYILYCHPEAQKTPRPDKLRQWYQSMLKKATEEKIVVNFSNLYEKFFVPSGESNTKVTAARLPYFDGDYWSGVAESMIKKIELESGGDPQKQIKKMTRRSLKAMGHINPSATDARDILLMQALAQSISSAKEDFIIVYLQFVCTHCHEVILSGKRWLCNQCKNYQLCERCHDKELQSGQGDTHMSSSGHKHALSQEMVNDVPVDTEDNDAIMDNCFLENRHVFLSFCQGNHYQFDSLRRAKHSSMMILYHLHNPNGSNMGTVCNLCLKDIDAKPRWTCEICPEFHVCSTCYQRNNVSCHIHTLTRHLPPAITPAESKTAKMVRELLDVVLHASRCRTTMGHPCSYPYCTHLRRLFCHSHACGIRVAGGCRHCKKTWFVLMLHSRRCKDANCIVPRCMDLKEYAKKLETESNARHRTMQSVS